MHRDWDVSQNEEAVDRWQCFLFSSCSGKDGFNHFRLIYRIMRSNMKDKEKLSELLNKNLAYRNMDHRSSSEYENTGKRKGGEG